MMGRLNPDQEQLFYSFRLDEAVPHDHPVRKIAAVLDLSWVHSELAPFYPKMGRPSIDPDTKPAIGEVHLYISAYRSLRANCEYVAHDEHPDHQFRINRGSTHFRVKGREIGMNPRQIENRSNLANRVIVRNCLIKMKRIKQLLLVVIEPPHHRSPPQRIA